MCFFGADGAIDVEERKPRYYGEPKRKRMSFVRDGDKRYSAGDSDELSIYRPRTASYPVVREQRNSVIPSSIEPYRSPAQPVYPRYQDYIPPPPPPAPMIPNQLPFRPPPMIHQEPFNPNPHGIVDLSGSGHDGFGKRPNSFGNGHNDFGNGRNHFVEEPIMLESPPRVKMLKSGGKKPKVIKVHRSSGGGSRSHDYYDDDSDSDSFVSVVHRARSVYSDDSWSPRYKSEKGGSHRRSGSHYRR